MDLEKINKLLTKYYEGDTSIEEEIILIDFFQKADIPAELTSEKEWFNYLIDKKKESNPPKHLTKSIVDLIDHEDGKEKKGKIIQLGIFISGIAASIILLITLYPWNYSNNQTITYNDTFEDPMEAYENVKSTLHKISGMMQKNTKDLNHLSTLNKGFEKVNIVKQNLNEVSSKKNEK